LISFVRLQKSVIFGKMPERFAGVREAPFSMVLPLVVLAILCLGIGIAYPFIHDGLLEAARDALLDKVRYVNLLIGS